MSRYPNSTCSSSLLDSCHPLLLMGLVSLLSGCSGFAKPEPVGLDPPEVAAAIIEEFDADRDGALSKSEIKASKSLSFLSRNELNPLDVDQDGSVTNEEIEAKIQGFVEENRITVFCYVFYRRQPLRDAEIRFVPETFMGPTLVEATGTSNAEGLAEIEDGGEFGGMVSGLYKVEITHPTVNISPEFNTETTLGIAVDGTNPYVAPTPFNVR